VNPVVQTQFETNAQGHVIATLTKTVLLPDQTSQPSSISPNSSVPNSAGGYAGCSANFNYDNYFNMKIPEYVRAQFEEWRASGEVDFSYWYFAKYFPLIEPIRQEMRTGPTLPCELKQKNWAQADQFVRFLAFKM
jgi:hypothetical protein